MTPLQLAHKYLECIYDTGDLKDLSGILSDDLHFKGTYFEYDSADEYITAFEGDSLAGFSYEILHAFEKDNTVCFIYNLIKPSGPLEMAQVFEIEGEKIKNIHLIFDGREFDEVEEDDDEWNL